MSGLLIYDGSFEGFLTAVFEIYERKFVQGRIIRTEFFQPLLYGEPITVIADEVKAMRVWKGLKNKVSATKCNEVYKTFLSEMPEMEDVLLSFIRYVFESNVNVESDFSHKAVLAVTQIAKQVHREKHRMEAFVRFHKTEDDVYVSTIEPDFNVLPLIASHFKDRYADQHWIIYDKKRNYGIQYEIKSEKVFEVQLDEIVHSDQKPLNASVCAEDEPNYQILWQQYFKSVNIQSRNNHKLHVRHVPLRYWKYLVEKNPL